MIKVSDMQEDVFNALKAFIAKSDSFINGVIDLQFVEYRNGYFSFRGYDTNEKQICAFRIEVYDMGITVAWKDHKDDWWHVGELI